MHGIARVSKATLPLYVRKNPYAVCAPAAFSSFSRLFVQPRPRLNLEPSLQTLLQDVDMALHSHVRTDKKTPHELEIIPSQERNLGTPPDDFDQGMNATVPRKSPAALFGSQRVGTIVLPLELQDAIQRLISDANRPELHNDAKRLFQKDGSGTPQWEHHYDAKYRTRIQAVKHEKRDGTAFASVALPAHYSAIYAVLDHVKRRLGSTWQVGRVLDWGAGTGSGLWASLYCFQACSSSEVAMNDFRVADSTLTSYVGIEKRKGLTKIGRQLMQDVQPKHLTITWQKGWRTEDNLDLAMGKNTIALSAFLLTTLPDALARKKMVREIWDSGANTMILIDHNSKEGFEAIAAARQYLLTLGHKGAAADERSNLASSHVVAPCPHDGECPLYFRDAIKLVCGYSQRIQRPEFVRRTKRSSVGHEDIGYSYVVIQRGPRPRPTITGLGTVGAVGRWELDKTISRSSMREIHPQDVESSPQLSENNSLPLAGAVNEGLRTADETHEAIRLEAYQWPRLIFPPLKKSGHIILDGCTAEGKIMRMTIPKSQGKQPFYDARKSAWGDIFPHPPKNKPQERQHVLKPGSSYVSGSDIGKRGRDRTREGVSYEQIAKELDKRRERSQRYRQRMHQARDDDVDG